MRVGVERDFFQIASLLAGERIELGDRFNLVAKHGNAPGAVLIVGGKHLDGIAARPEAAARKGIVIALILQRHQIAEQLLAADFLTEFQGEGHGGVGLDRADTVNAGDRRDDDHVLALQQRARRGMAHAVDLFVDRAFLLDISVRTRNIGFRLVVIVIGHEILNRIVREERLEFIVKLRGEGLVGREDQRRALRGLDDLRHGESLAGTGRAEQHLIPLAIPDTLGEFRDRGDLIAGGLIVRDYAQRPRLAGRGRALRPMRHPFVERHRKPVMIGRDGFRESTLRHRLIRGDWLALRALRFRVVSGAMFRVWLGWRVVWHDANIGRTRGNGRGQFCAAARA